MTTPATAARRLPFALEQNHWDDLYIPALIKPHALTALRVVECVLKLTAFGAIFLGAAAATLGFWSFTYLSISTLSFPIVLASQALPLLIIGGVILTLAVKIIKNEPMTTDALGTLAYLPILVFYKVASAV